MGELSKGKQLEKELTYSVKHTAIDRPELVEKSWDFCEGYKDFLSSSKTEREAVKNIIEIAQANGYTEFNAQSQYNPGDKVYCNNRNRALILSTIGEQTVDFGTHIIASHIDAPRLDLKPSPLYLKTHYYGGVKKYQWATIPLAIHGIIYRADGSFCEINIGEDPTDPVFVITDLLPHLAKDQSERKMKDVIKGEEMNVVVSSLPYADDEVKEAVKLATLLWLNEKYG
ncbi:MAG: aminopeptidase, partial [Oscillospiraceae bacterium]